MKRFGQILIAVFVVFCGSILLAHSGRTDSSGGHNNRKTGGYHYHHGRGPHQHPNGICPYSSPPTEPSKETPKNTVKKPALPKQTYKKVTPKQTYKKVVLIEETTKAKPISITENHWQVALNNKLYNGKREATVSSGSVDILTDTLAIEVDKVSKYNEGIKQALKYASVTGKKPVLALYIDGERNGYELYREAERLCRYNRVFLVLINSLVSVNELIALAQASKSTSLGSKNQSNYWLNIISEVRHNMSCRWYNNTKNGRKCTKGEGWACGTCGG